MEIFVGLGDQRTTMTDYLHMIDVSSGQGQLLVTCNQNLFSSSVCNSSKIFFIIQTLLFYFVLAPNSGRVKIFIPEIILHD